MSGQLALTFLPADVEKFTDCLRGRGWVTSKELGANSESEKRILRELAQQANGAIVSYPGSPGYKLLENCTLEELVHGERAMRSQLREMALKWRPIRAKMRELQREEEALLPQS